MTTEVVKFDADPERVRNEVMRQLARSEGEQGNPATTAAAMSKLTFTVRPDHQLQRLLVAAAGRALTDQRAEFGLADLLSSSKGEHDASDVTGTDPSGRPMSGTTPSTRSSGRRAFPSLREFRAIRGCGRRAADARRRAKAGRFHRLAEAEARSARARRSSMS
jgi:hypothetical protein